MKVQITSKNKTKNPVDNSSNIYSYEGEFNMNMFTGESEQSQYLKSQISNIQKLTPILEELDLHFEYIWMGTFNNDYGHKANNFIIRTNLNNNGIQLFWIKYVTSNPQSGQNLIYSVKDDKLEKIQLSKWFNKYKEMYQLV